MRWLKILHTTDEREAGRWPETLAVGDPHVVRPDGPVRRPAYAPGDRMLVYLAGTYRCPALLRVLEDPAFDPGQERWGWRTRVAVTAAVPVADAPTVDELGIDRRSLGRHSRLRLDAATYARAARRLGAAAARDPHPLSGARRTSRPRAERR
jgi:hypothetical protein